MRRILPYRNTVVRRARTTATAAPGPSIRRSPGTASRRCSRAARPRGRSPSTARGGSCSPAPRSGPTSTSRSLDSSRAGRSTARSAVTGGSGWTSVPTTRRSTSRSPTGRSWWWVSGTARPARSGSCCDSTRTGRSTDSFGGDGRGHGLRATVRAGDAPSRSSRADRILVGGSVSNGMNESWAFARYLVGGGLDRSFGGDGRVTMSLSMTNEEVQDRSSSGRRGSSRAATRSGTYLPRFAIAKLRFDGGRVPSFGNNGVRVVNLGPGADSAYGLAIQDDGKPVLAGYASSNGRADWGLVRLGAGGSLDGWFSGDGIVTTAFTPSYELATSVAMQSDGRIVVVGRVHGPSGTRRPGGRAVQSRRSSRSVVLRQREGAVRPVRRQGRRSGRAGPRGRISRRRRRDEGHRPADDRLPALHLRPAGSLRRGLTRPGGVWNDRLQDV